MTSQELDVAVDQMLRMSKRIQDKHEAAHINLMQSLVGAVVFAFMRSGSRFYVFTLSFTISALVFAVANKLMEYWYTRKLKLFIVSLGTKGVEVEIHDAEG